MKASTSALWNTLYTQLFSFVYARVKDRPTAEDIVQDVFLKSEHKSQQLKEEEKMSAWIYQITRNAIIDYYRKKSQKNQLPFVGPEEEYNELNICAANCLRALMQELPTKYREALELTEFQNLSQLELGKHLQISYSGARSRVQRGRKLLREKLEALYQIKTDTYGNVVVCETKIPEQCHCDDSLQKKG